MAWVRSGEASGSRKCRSSVRSAEYRAANSSDNRVSLTIDHDTPDVMEITGLSMAARAQVVEPAEGEKALRMLMQKYPQQGSFPLPMPSLADVRIFRLTPTVISVLDYTKAFAHTDLVTC
jgi:hypothetical protein